MRRLASLAIGLVLALWIAVPASASTGPVYTATIDGSGLSGSVSVTLDSTHTTGTLTWSLSGISPTADVQVDVYGGSCAVHDGGVVFVTSYGTFAGGTGTRTVTLPSVSAPWFWFDWNHRGGASATVSDGGQTTCAAFAQTSPTATPVPTPAPTPAPTPGSGGQGSITTGPLYTATIAGAGLSGSVTVALDSTHTTGTLTWSLSGVATNGPVTVDVDGGTCATHDGGVVFVTSYGTFAGGTGGRTVALPSVSPPWFWFDWNHRGGVVATVSSGGHTTCSAFVS